VGMIGKDETPTPYELHNHGAGTLLVRSYRHEPQQSLDPLRLLLVGTGGDRHPHHPPEYAYLAQGWEVLEDGPAGWTLPREGMPMRIVTAPRVGSDKGLLALSWFTDGYRVVGSYRGRVLWDVWDRILGAPRPWVMVRLEIPVVVEQGRPSRLSLTKGEAALLPVAAQVQRQLTQMLAP